MTTIFAATGTDIIRFELTDGSARAAQTVLADVGAMCVAVDPRAPERVYVGTFDGGLFASEDRGHTWQQPEHPPAEPRVLSVAVSPAADHAYAGTEPSNLYRSEDHGRTWERLASLRELPSEPTWSFPPRPWTHHVRTIAPHPAESGVLAVGIELGGVMRSADGGVSWQDHNAAAHSDAHALLVHPGRPDRLYEIAGQGIALSEDRGATWHRLEGGLDRHYAWAGAVDPAQPDRWYAAVSRSPFAAHGSGDGEALLLRTDNGEWTRIDTWEKDEPALRRMPYALLTPEPDALLAGLRGGVMVLSDDAGASWRRLPLELPDVIALAA
jgi:photosystem II stability/assembly factor-like uncharacterized protein